MIKLLAELPAYIAVIGMWVSRNQDLDVFVASALLYFVTISITSVLSHDWK